MPKISFKLSFDGIPQDEIEFLSEMRIQLESTREQMQQFERMKHAVPQELYAKVNQITCYFNQLIDALEITVKLLTTNVNEGFFNLHEATQATHRVFYTKELLSSIYPKLNSLTREVFAKIVH